MLAAERICKKNPGAKIRVISKGGKPGSSEAEPSDGEANKRLTGYIQVRYCLLVTLR